MTPADYLLCVVDAYGGAIQGRTLLQKTSYFVALLTKSDVKLGFDAHYYGPYSATVEGTTTKLKNLGFIQESSTGFGIVNGGFEVRRYDYTITDDGQKILESLRGSDEYARIKSAVNRIVEAGNPNYVELSIAAKAFFLLRRKNGPMQISEIQKEAEKYNWSISPHSISKAVEFLKSLQLAA